LLYIVALVFVSFYASGLRTSGWQKPKLMFVLAPMFKLDLKRSIQIFSEDELERLRAQKFPLSFSKLQVWLIDMTTDETYSIEEKFGRLFWLSIFLVSSITFSIFFILLKVF